MSPPAPLSTWQQGLRPDPALVGRPAGFWIRVVAYMIDTFILSLATVLVVGIIVAIIALSGASFEDDDDGTISVAVGIGIGAGVVALTVIDWLYEALLTSSARGATLGKMALGLRVVRADGARLSFGRATARYFLKAMITPMVPFAIGYILAAFTKGKRALHDLLAETLVIRQG